MEEEKVHNKTQLLRQIRSAFAARPQRVSLPGEPQAVSSLKMPSLLFNRGTDKIKYEDFLENTLCLSELRGTPDLATLLGIFLEVSVEEGGFGNDALLVLLPPPPRKKRKDALIYGALESSILNALTAEQRLALLMYCCYRLEHESLGDSTIIRTFVERMKPVR